ncbi:Ig domain-containing protein [Nannocystis bainbridge]|uniref:Ig domain-containing protein n=1 Tax=Nannocystis bainbridge TaxID=2995303 RepID=A0ABT5EC90_9BACT|nr:Ig domain-containing protein [Nannocystis bainbridge]MDC0722401.1 Ig domain-containing protein [Nannocystis bainbridge]
MHLRPLVLTTAFVTSALVGCSREEFAPWGFAEDVSLECSSPARGQVGVPYSYTPTVVTGVSPFEFSVDPTTPLPAGLSIDAATGAITGTPTAEGTFPLKVVVVDSREARSVVTCGDIIIDAGAGIDCRDESVAPGDIPDGFVGYAYNFQATAIGGREPYGSWTDNGTLPAGLTIDAATGLVSGTPEAAGISNVTLTVTDAEGQEIASECGVLEIRDPIQVDPESLLAAYPDGCISYGEDLDGLIAKGIVIPVKDATANPTCALVAGRGNGSRNFDADANTPDSFPPGIAVSADTCELSGTIDTKLRFGAYAWITTIEQSGTKAYLPYCAPQDVQAGTAYGVERQDTGTDKTLAPGHIVFDVDGSPLEFTFGSDVPDPQVTVTYNEACGGSCFYAYIFSYNALSATAQVSAGPSAKFPAMGFDGFTHAIRVTENDETFLRNYGERAFVANISFDYCIAQNEDDCGNNEADPAAKAALIRANGDGSNYEFGLIVLPKN